MNKSFLFNSSERKSKTHKNFNERISLSLFNSESTEIINVNNRQNDNIKKTIDRFSRLNDH